MTDKRFRYEGAKIFDGEELLCCTLSIWAEQLVDLLNELHEENQQLRQILDIGETNAKDIVDVLNIQQSRIKELSEENKELKKQMNRLYNYFMDWYSDEMGGNQFSEMWDIVKESEKWEKR